MTSQCTGPIQLPEVKPLSPQAAREVRRDSPLRRARTCYGHLAGVAGVGLIDELHGRGWLEGMPGPADRRRVHYALTEAGAGALAERGVVIPAVGKGKPVAFSCLDWTERRWHLGGALGRAIVNAMAEAGYIKQPASSRVVHLTAPVGRWLNS